MQKDRFPKRAWMLFPLMLVISLAVDLLCWYLAPASVIYREEGTVRLLASQEIEKTRCTEEDGVLIPEKSNVRLEFQNEGNHTGSVILRLSRPLEQSSRLMLYYAAPGTELTKEQRVRLNTVEGREEICVHVPDGEWTSFRVDYTGRIALKEISLSEGKAVQSRKPYQVNFPRLLVLIASLCLLLTLWLFVKPVRSGLGYINRRILEPETRFKAVDYLYMAFAMVMLLHHVYDVIWLKNAEQSARLFRVSWFVFAGLGILLGRMWKNKGFWFLAVLFVLQYLRAAILFADDMAEDDHFFVNALFAFFGCYSVGRAIRPELRKGFLQCFCVLWTLAVAVLSALGIRAAWTEVPIVLPGGGTIAIYGRLYPYYHCIVFGVLASVSLMAAFVGSQAFKRRLARALLLFAMIIIFLAGILTVTRTGYVINAFGAGFLFSVWLEKRLWPGKKNRLAGIARGVTVLVVFLAAGVSLMWFQPRVIEGFNLLQRRGGLFIQTALAEVWQPNLNMNTDLNALSTGRIHIWTNVLNYLSEHRQVLFSGLSMFGVKEVLRTFCTNPHCHNVILQLVMEAGIPGLLLYFGFLASAFAAGLKLLKNRMSPMWKRVLFLPVAGCLIADLLDLTCYIRAGNPQMILLFLFAGMTVAISPKEGQRSMAKPRQSGSAFPALAGLGKPWRQ